MGKECNYSYLDETGDNRCNRSTGDAQLRKWTDTENEKNTYVSLLGLEKARQLAAQRTNDALAALEVFGADADSLRQLAEALLTRDH